MAQRFRLPGSAWPVVFLQSCCRPPSEILLLRVGFGMPLPDLTDEAGIRHVEKFQVAHRVLTPGRCVRNGRA
ncbi:hypothetical protein [Streptomyces sp. GQFP]|uniref:hypothetical protein n=1 Tax=Streptomyces sp. GQFP TaxID=2907545 RepID=UPI001F19D26F|nr:hypothetical protein [Streptomyces sp. GQFP]UIX29237.1 hypothetical protein LUX31_03910 [Streptomyces sp. GQFP]